MYMLQPYQGEAQDAVLSEWDSGHQRILLVPPTGTSKTVVFSSIIDHEIHDGRMSMITTSSKLRSRRSGYLVEREQALVRDLEEMRRRKRRLVDPLPGAVRILRQVVTWLFDEASNLIPRLAENHWNVPYGMKPNMYRL